jgi:hypothetical protein
MRTFYTHQESLNENGNCQFLVYVDDVNLFIEYVQTIKNIEGLLIADEEIRLEVPKNLSVCSRLVKKMREKMQYKCR